MIHVYLMTLLAWWPISSSEEVSVADEKVAPQREVFLQTPSPSASSSSKQTYRVVLDPSEHTTFSAVLPAAVKKINVKLGSTFKKGDVLIQFDDTVYKGLKQKAEAAFEKAYAKYKATAQLYEEDMISMMEAKEAKSAAVAAESDLITARKELEETQVIAPYDGKVVSIDVRAHEVPQKGKEILEIINDRILVAKLIIPSGMLPQLKVDQPLSIKIGETGQLITAKIKRIGASIDASSSTIKIEAEIENHDGKLTAGMTGDASFIVDDTSLKSINDSGITDGPKFK